MNTFNIKPTENNALKESVVEKINQKTKPLGALGRLEEIVLKIALIQGKEEPELNKPAILIFAGDHGIAREGVSAYPAEVTPQMVLNFVNRGAAINVFSKQHGIDLKIIDAGVNFDFESGTDIIHSKVNYGTKNFVYEPAMTDEELKKCFEKGARILDDVAENGTNTIGFGEMGIGNTSSASVIMSSLLELPIEDCVGRGTGLSDDQYRHKISLLRDVLSTRKIDSQSPYEVLQYFGGFEIAMMTAAMLRAAERRMIILVDGFISSAAFLCAYKMEQNILDYAFFCHLSQEKGHQLMIEQFHAEPLLDLNLRLGEGTGCAIAYPILKSSVLFLSEMASFESAGVSKKNKSESVSS